MRRVTYYHDVWQFDEHIHHLFKTFVYEITFPLPNLCTTNVRSVLSAYSLTSFCMTTLSVFRQNISIYSPNIHPTILPVTSDFQKYNSTIKLDGMTNNPLPIVNALMTAPMQLSLLIHRSCQNKLRIFPLSLVNKIIYPYTTN